MYSMAGWSTDRDPTYVPMPSGTPKRGDLAEKLEPPASYFPCRLLVVGVKRRLTSDDTPYIPALDLARPESTLTRHVRRVQ